uniref:U25-Theraphotoxin-Sfo1c_1 n=1 Tax=Selenotholus foelschei TaxID=1905327 RepID=A0A482ZDY7_9ARAC
MKISLLLAIASLCLLSIVYASGLGDKEILKEVERSVALDAVQAEERGEGDCLRLFATCIGNKKFPNLGCCNHLYCSETYTWCLWDGTG